MSEEQTPVETQPVETTASKSWFTDDGGWNREAFGEGLGEHTIFDKYKNPEELVKATINKDGLIGKKAEEFWTSTDPEIVSKRSKIMGVPEDASGYEFNVEFPEGIPISSERIEASKAVFKELGIPKAAAEKLIAWDVQNATEAYQEQIEQMEIAYSEAEGKLKGKWKNNYNNNMERVTNALDYIGMSEYASDMKESKNPLALKFAEAIHEKIIPLIQNDTIIESRQSQSLATIEDSLNALDDQIFSFPADQLHTSEYNRLVAKRGELLQKLG
jgi:hypothetical protein